eukprot:1187960-Prorocentrum_minimum.AAC.1
MAATLLATSLPLRLLSSSTLAHPAVLLELVIVVVSAAPAGRQVVIRVVAIVNRARARLPQLKPHAPPRPAQ